MAQYLLCLLYKGILEDDTSYSALVPTCVFGHVYMLTHIYQYEYHTHTYTITRAYKTKNRTGGI